LFQSDQIQKDAPFAIDIEISKRYELVTPLFAGWLGHEFEKNREDS